MFGSPRGGSYIYPIMEIKVMKRIDLKALIGMIALGIGAIGMITGDTQNVIAFADPINEIVFTLMLFMGAIGCAVNIKQ